VPDTVTVGWFKLSVIGLMVISTLDWTTKILVVVTLFLMSVAVSVSQLVKVKGSKGSDRSKGQRGQTGALSKKMRNSL